MELVELRAGCDLAGLGARMHSLVQELYPICRSITGEGVRETLRAVGERIPLDVRQVPTGTPVLDWTVPREWTIRDAFIADEQGNRVVDFNACNLHVVGYSIPVDRTVTRAELDEHLHSLPEQPDAIPFRTSYYSETWGFCVSQRQRDALTDERYRVRIDCSLQDGALTYAEHVVPGRVPDEVLVTTHVCHPSLANDNLSGIALLTELGALLAEAAPHFTYRLLFNPVTIGSITWLAEHEADVQRVRHGLVIAGIGDPGGFTYKRSRRGDAPVDRAVAHVLAAREAPHSIEAFSPYGYDERQFCSPGFNLPLGCLSRTPHGRYPEYHTSLDTPGFVVPAQLGEALDVVLEVLDVLEGDRRYRNLMPYGEPQLGRRGLYKTMGGHADAGAMQMAILWTLNLSDGDHTLLDIAERSGLGFDLIREAAEALMEASLLAPLDSAP